MTTFPIAIDATQLFYRFFIIPGVTPDFISSRTVQTLELAPGDYSFQVQSGVFTDLSFTVTFQGTLDYDHSCDTFLSGRGTSSLQLIGLEVTLDASSLSGASGGGGVLLASSALTNDDWIQRRTVRLLPQSTFWVQQGSGLIAQLAFGLQRDGRFSYAPELDATQGGPLMGAGTNTLTFKGHTVLVDASTVSRFLMVHPILAVEPAQDGKTSIVVLPADGFRLQLDQGVTDLGFSVGITGAVTLNPEMRDWLGIFPGSVGVPPTVRVLHHPAPEQADPAATSRFCGVPDTPPQMLGTRPLSYGSPIGRWTRGNLTINVNKTDSKGVDADVIDNIVLSVYRQYELQQPFFFSFTKKDDPDSDIRVQFGGRDGIPPRGGLGGPDGRLWISAQNIWTPRSLLQILLHEAGHTLGLSHSTLSTSVMYPFYTEDTLVKKIDPVTGRPTTPKIDDKTISTRRTR